MMNDAKESYVGHLSCKGHTARTEKDLFRICPSKLSKRELEDLYFSLLEQNVQLKKTINEQRDQIKVLNTKLQRMTVPKPALGFHNKDCCAGSKAIINEQKESIADLKKANERLSERLRLLNMRLCSAKQFLRRGSSQAASHCPKCLVSSASIKNSSMSALNTKRSDSKLRIDSSSCHVDKDNIAVRAAEIDIPTRSAEITSSQTAIPVRDAPCQRSECRTEIDELKLKIVLLQEEVCSVRRSHSERMRALEAGAGAHLACSERAARLAGELRRSRARADELETQLQLHRARVSESSTRRREEDVTERLDRAAASLSGRPLPLVEAPEEAPPATVSSDWENCVPILAPNNSGISIFVEDKGHKNSDDSGFTDYKNKELAEGKETTFQEPDDNIESQTADFQSQIDYLQPNPTTEKAVQGVSLGEESSLSHDIFSNSRFKILPEFDKVPSTTRLPEVLVSTDRVNVEQTSEKTQKYGPAFKYNIPAPLSLDMPRMSLRDTGLDNKIAENDSTDKIEGYKSKGSIKISSDKVEQKKRESVDGDENTIINSLDKTNRIIREIIEEGKTNNAFKKSRRSSIRSPYESKQSRDLAVRYGRTRTYSGSAEPGTSTKNVSRGTDIDKAYIEPDEDHESDPSVQYKMNERASIRRIRYTSDVRTDPYVAPEPKSLDFERDDGDPGGRGGGARGPPEPAHHMRETIADDGYEPAPPRPPAPDETVGEVSSLTELSRSPGTYGYIFFWSLKIPIETSTASSFSLNKNSLESSPVDYISPGEEKATSTPSESSAAAEGVSLSEGEVPAMRGKRLSPTTDNMNIPVWGNRSDKMEEALLSIGEELARCRELLQGRREEVREREKVS